MHTCIFALLGAAGPSYWRFHAEVDGGPAMSGELEASPSGTLTVVPEPGVQRLFGRGVGTWHRRPSGVLEARAQLYTYTIAAQPDAPTELLCVCRRDATGELRGCLFAAEGDRPQVGTLRARPLPGGPRLRGWRPRPLRLAAHARLPPFEPAGPPPRPDGPLALGAFRVGGLSEVYYIPDFVSEAEQAAIDEQLAGSPAEMWRATACRRVQECGSSMAPSGAGLVMEELPPWMGAICERLVACGLFPACAPPNSIALNEYGREQGIAPHADGPIYAPRVAILSLFSGAVFRFYGRQPELPGQTAWSDETETPDHTPRGPPVETLLLRPRSLLLFTGDAYREHCHEVAAAAGGVEVLGEAAPLVNAGLADAAEGQTVVRGERRVSLTIRHLLAFLLAPEAFEDPAAAPADLSEDEDARREPR